MNFEDFKKRAGELKKDFQENVMPEIKEKTGKAKESVTDFVNDKLKNSSLTKESEEKPLDEEKINADEKNSADEKLTEEENTSESAEQVHEEVPERVEGTIVGSFRDRVGQVTRHIIPEKKNNPVKEAAGAVVPKVKEAAGVVVPKVKDAAEVVVPKVKDTAVRVGGKIKNVTENGAEKLKENAKNAAENVSFNAYRIKKETKKKIGNSIVDSLRDNLFPEGQDAPKKKADKGKKDNKDAGKAFAAITESNALMHAKTIISHRHLVIEHCIKAGIPLQGLTHDLSKFSPAEFMYGVKFFQGDRSPNEGEREDHGYSNAWMHHKGRNKHHFEYWLDYNIEANKAIPVKMPLKYVIEMFCDRVAAGKTYLKDKYTDKSPLEYFEKGRARRNIHPETSKFLEKLLRMLAVKGEDYTFMYIKWYMKHHEDY